MARHPEFVVRRVATFVTRMQAETAGVSFRAPSRRLTLAQVVSDEGWVIVALDAEWIAAYRLASQNGGLVVAELRIYPRTAGLHAGRVVAASGQHCARVAVTPGEWPGALAGLRAIVPTGGLTSSIVRRARLTRDVNQARDLGAVFWRRGDTPSRRALLASGAASPEPVPQKKAGGAGRPGKRTTFYRRVASVYGEALGRGEPPVQQVARALKLTRPVAGYAVLRARQLGFLPATTQGKTSPLPVS